MKTKIPPKEYKGVLIKGCPYSSPASTSCKIYVHFALSSQVNRQGAAAAGWCGWRRPGIVVYFYLSGTTCLGSLNGNFASDRERTAGRIPSCESSCFRPTDTPSSGSSSFPYSPLSLTFIFIFFPSAFSLFLFSLSLSLSFWPEISSELLMSRQRQSS